MDVAGQMNESLSFIRRLLDRSGLADHPRHVGLILGSGLGALAEEIHSPCIIPYSEIAGFPLSHVSGHAGNLVMGRIGQTEVVALAGRAHLYEGWAAQQATYPVRVLAALGVKNLVVSNASGGINPRFRSGQVVLMDQHIDAMRRSPFSPTEFTSGANAQKNPSERLAGSPGFVADGDCTQLAMRSGHHLRLEGTYDERLMKQAEREAVTLGFSLSRGTYLATLGPTYETRAEYRMFARLGADMVGMSTVPEVIVARSLGLRVLAFSIVTNVATPDAPTKTDHHEVLDWSRQAQSQLVPLIKKMLSDPKGELCL